MLERIRAAQDLRPTHKTGSHRPDSKANKRDGHYWGRLVDVVLDFVRDARGPPERHEKKAEHIKRGQPRGDQRNGPEDLVTVGARERLPQDVVLAEKPGEEGSPPDGQRPPQHGLCRPWNPSPQAARLPDVLVDAQNVDDAA